MKSFVPPPPLRWSPIPHGRKGVPQQLSFRGKAGTFQLVKICSQHPTRLSNFHFLTTLVAAVCVVFQYWIREKGFSSRTHAKVRLGPQQITCSTYKEFIPPELPSFHTGGLFSGRLFSYWVQSSRLRVLSSKSMFSHGVVGRGGDGGDGRRWNCVVFRFPAKVMTIFEPRDPREGRSFIKFIPVVMKSYLPKSPKWSQFLPARICRLVCDPQGNESLFYTDYSCRIHCMPHVCKDGYSLLGSTAARRDIYGEALILIPSHDFSISFNGSLLIAGIRRHIAIGVRLNRWVKCFPEGTWIGCSVNASSSCSIALVVQ